LNRSGTDDDGDADDADDDADDDDDDDDGAMRGESTLLIVSEELSQITGDLDSA
jgi:hypothetical protein